MANYKGHIAGGLIAGGTYVSALNLFPGDFLPNRTVVVSDWQLLVSLLVVSVLFGLWPDVDTNSKAQDMFFGMAFAANVFLIINGYFVASAFLGLLAMTPIIGHHRGWTHSKLAMFLVPLPIVLVPYLSSNQLGETGTLIYGAAVVGYFSHLLLDGLIWKRIRVRGGW